MHPDRPARPRLRAAALSILALVAATGASSPVIADPLVRVRPRILSALERSASTARPITLPPAVQQPVPQQPVPQQPVPQQPVPPRPTKQPPRVLAPARVDSTPRRGSPPPTVTKRAPTDSIAKRPPTDSAAKRAPSAPAAQRPDSVAAKSPPPALVDSSARAEPLTRQRPAPILLVHVDSGAGRQSYYDFAVQAPVDFAPGGSPALRYPDILHSAQRGGVLVVQMVVDTSGLMLPGSLRVVHKSHDLFEASFRAEMDKLRFRPARVGEQRVRQLVQLVYRFRVDGMEAIAPVEVSSDVRTLEVTVSVKPR